MENDKIRKFNIGISINDVINPEKKESKKEDLNEEAYQEKLNLFRLSSDWQELKEKYKPYEHYRQSAQIVVDEINKEYGKDSAQISTSKDLRNRTIYRISINRPTKNLFEDILGPDGSPMTFEELKQKNGK